MFHISNVQFLFAIRLNPFPTFFSNIFVHFFFCVFVVVDIKFTLAVDVIFHLKFIEQMFHKKKKKKKNSFSYSFFYVHFMYVCLLVCKREHHCVGKMLTSHFFYATPVVKQGKKKYIHLFSCCYSCAT